MTVTGQIIQIAINMSQEGDIEFEYIQFSGTEIEIALIIIAVACSVGSFSWSLLLKRRSLFTDKDITTYTFVAYP